MDKYLQLFKDIDWTKHQKELNEVVGKICYQATDPYFVFGALGGISSGLIIGYAFWGAKRPSKKPKKLTTDQMFAAQSRSAVSGRDNSDARSEVGSVGYVEENGYIEKEVKLKLLFIVRMDTAVTKGQIAAWISHAAILMFRKLSKKHLSLLKSWLEMGAPKVSLRATGEKDLLNIREIAAEHGIPFCQINGAENTKMVIAVGPASQDTLKEFTGHLKLL
eukprot:TRINITY_DN749_c1_g4_i1.p2 TRINITY_DN749_c1_g4~~TRINITY_DN749_c1_g4_i1.p2  ORF type:complete len:240 (-),score=38.39 TRINITY_DN749_c1_g4_i1:1329-1988(-)